MMTENDENRSGSAEPTGAARQTTCAPACPVCGGPLEHIKQKTVCSRCRSIVETCCEGGRG